MIEHGLENSKGTIITNFREFRVLLLCFLLLLFFAGVYLAFILGWTVKNEDRKNACASKSHSQCSTELLLSRRLAQLHFKFTKAIQGVSPCKHCTCGTYLNFYVVFSVHLRDCAVLSACVPVVDDQLHGGDGLQL